MARSVFRAAYIERIPQVVYVVLLDGVEIWRTSDYLSGVGACVAWRHNNPREDMRRVRLSIEV